jgi:carboxylesterase
VRELLGLVAAVKKELPGVSSPALLIHAINDDIASIWNARYVQQHMSGPSELVLLQNSYHMITVDQERKKVCDVTASFAWNLLSDEEKNGLAANASESIPAFIYRPEDAAGLENRLGTARSDFSDLSDDSGDSQAC